MNMMVADVAAALTKDMACTLVRTSEDNRPPCTLGEALHQQPVVFRYSQPCNLAKDLKSEIRRLERRLEQRMTNERVKLEERMAKNREKDGKV